MKKSLDSLAPAPHPLRPNPFSQHIPLLKASQAWQYYLPALVALGLAAVLNLGSIDKHVFIFLNHLASYLPDTLWACITMLGHTSVAFALLALTLLWRPVWMMSCVAVAPLAAIVIWTGKALVDELRPGFSLYGDNIHIIGQRLLYVSFPSGHSVTAVALASAIMGCELGKPATRSRIAMFAGLIIYAIGVPFSRIAVGAHWPVDVLCGSAMGWAFGMMAGRWARNHPNFTESPHWQSVVALLTIIMCSTLPQEHTGYPQAQWLVYLAVVVGCVSSLCLLIRQRHHLAQWPRPVFNGLFRRQIATAKSLHLSAVKKDVDLPSRNAKKLHEVKNKS